jgi:hypothetical protein
MRWWLRSRRPLIRIADQWRKVIRNPSNPSILLLLIAAAAMSR